MLFEAFAPKRLKKVLEHAKTIEMKPLRRLFGMDLAPVLKLLLTSLMIGLMAGLSIAPQTGYLRAAGDALCGKCHCGRCCLARPTLLMAPCSHGCVGGPLDWAFGVDKVRCNVPCNTATFLPVPLQCMPKRAVPRPRFFPRDADTPV